MSQGRSRSTLFPYTTLFRSCGLGPALQRELSEWLFAGQPETSPCARWKCEPHLKAHFMQNLSPRHVKTEESLRLGVVSRSEEHTSELQSHSDLVCRLLLEKK